MHTNRDAIRAINNVQLSHCHRTLKFQQDITGSSLCQIRISDLILCTKKQTAIILRQQNGRDIPAERYADIIKPTAKLLTFIWEM